MTENVFEMSRRNPDIVLRILLTEMKNDLYTSKKMWKEGIDEVVPDMVTLEDKIKGLEKLKKNWEKINKKREKMIEDVL